MSKLKLSDFRVGQVAYIKRTGNQEIYIKEKDNLDAYIIETKVKSIGRKYITTEYKGIKFKETDCSYAGLIENTEYIVDYELFSNKDMIYDEFEKKNLINFIKKEFYTTQTDKFSLKQLRNIVNIIKAGAKDDRITDNQ